MPVHKSHLSSLVTKLLGCMQHCQILKGGRGQAKIAHPLSEGWLKS